MTDYARLDAWIDAHFDEEVRFLQELVRVPTDTPPGNNAPHAERTAQLLQAWGLDAESHPVPAQEVRDYGLQSITNLIVRREYGAGGPRVALNAHGDVVPPGEGWQHDPYGGEIDDGSLYGRAAAVSKSDFASYTFALRALEAVARPSRGAVELHFTYDEEFGGLLGPGWLLSQGLTKPDLLIAAGFSYEVVTAHNGCLQMKVTVHGKMAHAAIPSSGVDALQGAVAILNALYAQNARYREIRSEVPGISHPYLNVGRIEGGTNTNVVPGKVTFKLDRRMIPEENAAEVEADIRRIIQETAASVPGISVDIKRLLLANSMRPLPGSQPLVEAIQKHGKELFGEPIAAMGTPLYTDVRLYAEAGIPGVIYGAGPRTVLESHAKRNDERVVLEDLRRATKVIARTLADLLAAA
ncbi:M20 family metallopeptidase [Achromobacter anxifer]|uniref:M20 family metallopeptidase n=1 Tax=Achromobacter anxifer TaxID=1287737 RepID=UPI0021570E44|nr:M20/M25/M40 family metallo-hydrolase [Achromobacter anxifer]